MEDLDAELLAVTEGKKRPGRSNRPDNSASSGGEFEGMMDSDAGDDDDAMLDADEEDDDDDDDDEFGLDDDDDDDDYSKSKPRSTRKKQSTARPKKPKPRAKPRRKSATKPPRSSASDLDDDDGDLFEYKYDADGYGDSDDRDRLARMNEVVRETLLTERVEARQKEFEVWKMRREMRARESGRLRADGSHRTARSSARSKPTSKSDALQALAEDKRKKSSRALDDVSDADSEVERHPKRDAKKDEVRADRKTKDELDPMDDDEGPELRYSDLVKDSKTSPLVLRRDLLTELSQEPYFERLVMGLFARIRSVDEPYSASVEDSSYLLCRIVGVEKRKPYNLERGLRSNFYLRLQIGEGKRWFALEMVSSMHPTEREFNVYRSRTLDARLEMPRREEVDKLLKRAHSMIYGSKPVATEEEHKKHVANMELLYPARVNWTRKRTESQTALQIKRQELSNLQRKGNEEDVERVKREVGDLEEQLRDIDAKEKQYGVKSGKTDQDVFHSLAKRNMQLNTTNDLLMAKRRTLEADGGGIDPFARFDTTGQSYFSMKKKGDTGEDSKPVRLEGRLGKAADSMKDWRYSLRTWRAGGKPRKISDQAVDPRFAVELVGLDDFLKEYATNESVSKKGIRRIPPGVDAVYADEAKKCHFALPKKAKVISFDEWSKMRS